MTSAIKTPPARGGPAWEIAKLFPDQGHWSEGDYLVLNRHTNHLVELSDGRVEVLEMPTKSHQQIVLRLYESLREAVAPQRLGEVLVAPYPVRLGEGKFREPDVLFMLREHASRLGEDYAEGADLVMEVVSEDRARDLVEKRREYAETGIAEYWIVDPREGRITVLKLEGGRYVPHGEYEAGQVAASHLLSGFAVRVDDVFPT